MTKYKKAEWNGYENECDDGPYMDEYCNIGHIKDGKLHREDGPAIEWSNGDKFWYLNGKLHREYGPAIKLISGHEEWWVNGKEYHAGITYKEALKIWKTNEVMK